MSSVFLLFASSPRSAELESKVAELEGQQAALEAQQAALEAARGELGASQSRVHLIEQVGRISGLIGLISASEYKIH